ncbi:30S ribosomal protein S19 [Patescibacteria group bacterium]
MPRSSKKGPWIDERLLKKIEKVSLHSKEIINTWSRASSISPEMVGYTFGVHNGREFIKVKITEDMVGHKLGEFSHTRKFVKHGGKKQKELEQKAAQAARESAQKTTS